MKTLIFIASTFMSLLLFSSCEDNPVEPTGVKKAINHPTAEIYGFYPDRVFIENEDNVLIISGRGFTPYNESTYVEIGPLEAYIENISKDLIQVRVPQNLAPGYHKLKVVNNGQVLTFENQFYVTSKKF